MTEMEIREAQFRIAIKALKNDILQFEISNRKLREFCQIVCSRVDYIEQKHSEIMNQVLKKKEKEGGEHNGTNT